MEGDDVKVLSHWPSPFVMRAVLALELKGVKYEVVEQETLAVKKSPLLLQSNPLYQKVPVLLHNNKSIPESLVIVRYVDDAWPEDVSRPGFFPKDPYLRAITHLWSDFIDKKIFDVIARIVKEKGEEKEAALGELYGSIVALERGFMELEGKPFLHGSSMGYADITLAPFVAWMATFVEVVGVRIPDIEEAPHFHSFCNAISEHPAAKVAFPDQQRLLAHGRMLQQRLNAST